MTDHMAVLNGCEDKRNAVTIEEVKCPKCGAEMEIYVKDGKVNRVTVSGTKSAPSPFLRGPMLTGSFRGRYMIDFSIRDG